VQNQFGCKLFFIICKQEFGFDFNQQNKESPAFLSLVFQKTEYNYSFNRKKASVKRTSGAQEQGRQGLNGSSTLALFHNSII
jgi:hypothetical protein